SPQPPVRRRTHRAQADRSGREGPWRGHGVRPRVRTGRRPLGLRSRQRDRQDLLSRPGKPRDPSARSAGWLRPASQSADDDDAAGGAGLAPAAVRTHRRHRQLNRPRLCRSGTHKSSAREGESPAESRSNERVHPALLLPRSVLRRDMAARRRCRYSEDMYGHLVPSSGGEALPLRKTRMFLGRAKGSDAPLCRDNAYCQLELIEGFWHIEDLNTPQGLKVNGRTCKRPRLMPDEEITIGRHRYRISFEAPRYAGVGRLAKNQRPHRAASPLARTETMDVPTAPVAGGVLGRLVPIGG